jgi:gliding motility-associated-like protein
MRISALHQTRQQKKFIALITAFNLCVLMASSQNCYNWLKLSGYPSFVSVGDLDVPGNQITVEAQINLTQPYPRGPSLGSDIVAKYADPADANYLLRAQNAQITTTNGFYQTPDVCPLQLNKTYHIALVYDGVTLKFYRNGFLMSQIPATGNLVQNNWRTEIGFYQYAFNNTNFIGYINEVRIWNVARSMAQIQTYMNISLPNPRMQLGLVAYYTFDDLTNKQGNPTWNGVLNGASSINNNNPQCPFTTDNDCCPPIQGTFTGNSICSGQTGYLTFSSTTTPIHAPYTLSYSYQGVTYSQDNVKQGLPFAVSVNPTITSQYPLLEITDAGNCSTDISGESATITVIKPVSLTITPDTGICLSTSVQLNVSGAVSYSWSPAATLNNPNISNPIAYPTNTIKYYATGKDVNNCTVLDSVTVHFISKPVFNAPEDQKICQGTSVVLKGNNDPGYVYAWSPANLLNDDALPSPTATPAQTTVFHLVIADATCRQYDSAFDIQVVVNDTPTVTAGKANNINCSTLTAQLTATGATSYSWLPSTGLSDPLSASPVATISETTQFVVQGTNAEGCTSYDSVTVAVAKTGENAYGLPNSFTPNGDGINDCFGLRNWGSITLLEFSIYNRWGQKVFETKNPSDCWDGRFQGEIQPSGGFIYIIKASSFCGVIIRKGSLLLIR